MIGERSEDLSSRLSRSSSIVSKVYTEASQCEGAGLIVVVDKQGMNIM